MQITISAQCYSGRDIRTVSSTLLNKHAFLSDIHRKNERKKKRKKERSAIKE